MRRLRTPEPLTPPGAELGEGPCWDARAGCLVWVDILAGLVHLTERSGASRVSHAVGTHVGAALPAERGGWLLAVQDGFALLDESGASSPLLSVHGRDAGLRFNDAKCDPRGRAFAGTMAYDLTPGAGALYRLDDGPSVQSVLSGVSIGNGLGWSPDHRSLYFVDTLERGIAMLPYDADTGTVGQPSALVEVEDTAGYPDGLCVDDDGCIWVALWDGAAVRRYRPDGTLDAVAELPVTRPTSCCIADGVLYVTSATHELSAEERERQPHAGAVFALDVGVGAPAATPWRTVRTREGR